MDKLSTACSSKSHEEQVTEDFQNVVEVEEPNSESDLDSNGEIFAASDEEEDVQLSSSPSNSLNSDVEQRWYAFRGRWGVNMPAAENPLPAEQNQQQQQDEEETDFLEMDFEPETNSEIENEAKFSDYVHRNPAGPSNPNPFNFHPPPQLPLDSDHDFERPRNTGTKPKQLTQPKPVQKNIKQASDGDNVFKISSTVNNQTPSSLHFQEVYNVGASSSRDFVDLKIHKSPAKSSSHNHKHLRLQDEQNDQFLFEIDPLRPRNSVTIYTTNCDEKILIESLTSLNLQPNRETIATHFNRLKSTTDLGLVDFIIHRSKLNCNYLKLIELIQRVCRTHEEDDYGDKKFDINFYPLDLFSTTPEMIEVPVDEIARRWTPQTDLTPLINIRNKFFYQTNVLGKVVNIIRKLNHKPPATFRDNETIKIPQFYVSGYITITLLTKHGFKSS